MKIKRINKKIVIILFFVVLILFIFFVINFVFYDKYKMPEGAYINIENKEIEVYDKDIKMSDFIKDKNVEIISNDYNIDTNMVGKFKKTIEYKYKSKLKKYKFDIEYEIKDTTNPIFIQFSNKRTLYLNEDPNEELLKNISYADNYDQEPSCSIEGEIDTKNIGTYNVKYILKDSSGNEVTKNAKVSVIEKKSSQNGNTNNNNSNNDDNDTRISFSNIKEKYKTNKNMVGIDVSKWQGEIDFQKVKDDGADFVIIRLGYMKNKDSEPILDPYFESNIKEAKKAGLKVGVYFYSVATNEDIASDNAKFILDNLKGQDLDLPIFFDWEEWEDFEEFNINLFMLNQMYDAFKKAIKDKYETALYGSEYYLNEVWLNVKDYKLWAANYSKEPSLDYMLWQLTDNRKN